MTENDDILKNIQFHPNGQFKNIEINKKETKAALYYGGQIKKRISKLTNSAYTIEARFGRQGNLQYSKYEIDT